MSMTSSVGDDDQTPIQSRVQGGGGVVLEDGGGSAPTPPPATPDPPTTTSPHGGYSGGGIPDTSVADDDYYAYLGWLESFWQLDNNWVQDVAAINGTAFLEWQYGQGTIDVNNADYWLNFFGNGFKLPESMRGLVENMLGSGSGRWSGGGGGGGGGGRAEAIKNLEEVVRNMTGTIGLFTDNATITAIATQAVDGRWDQATLEQTVVQKAKDAGWQNLSQDGAIRTMMAGIGDAASQFLIRMSDESKAEYAFRIATSEMDQEAILTTIRESAKQQYAWAAKQIDQGMTVRDIVLPLRDTIASELEMAPEAIDLMNKKWQQVLTVPNREGSERMATTDEVMRQVRQMGAWQNTSAARETTAQAAQYLTRMFGGGII